ncbi:MAG: hypothetical protein J5802_03520 [Butyrivibrio sp.]|nr:hypothetical protein [Butyrivibrio sp.]
MENFMDKLAEKLSAQDIIKANSQAEVAEAQRIKKEAEHYKKEIEEMRRNAENYRQQLEDIMDVSRDYTEEFERIIRKIDESDLKTHDVGVQTYRNIQALLEKDKGKGKGGGEEISEINKKLETVLDIVEYKNNALGPLIIIVLLIVAADLTFNVLRIFGAF